MSGPELLSIIVPVYNEARTVRRVNDQLLAIELPIAHEILIVDDGSSDGTGDILAAAVRDGLPVTVIRRERRGGKGSAVRRGLQEARGSILAIQDADLELDPQQLATLVAPIVRGEATAMYGSRFLTRPDGAPWLTVAANRFLTGATNLLFRSSITDMETCYKVMRVDVARSLGRSPPGSFDRASHPRAAHAIRSAVARPGQEDRLARRRARPARAREGKISDVMRTDARALVAAGSSCVPQNLS